MDKSPVQNRIVASLKNADIKWSESGQPQSAVFDDVYFSRASGVDETQYVFIDKNNLAQRWNTLNQQNFTIAETGFGTGLNFLCAAKLWLEIFSSKEMHHRLHYISAEKYPLSKPDLKQALSLWQDFAPLSDELVDQYPVAVPGVHRLSLARGKIILTLLYGDAAGMFASITQSDHPLFSSAASGVVDAWFLDGFAPSKNPDMWTEQLFQQIASLSGKGSTFSTFTAAGIVKRGLETAGFSVSKVPGFGQKREMLCGEISSLSVATSIPSFNTEPAAVNSLYQPPWYLNEPEEKRLPESAIVIGGGIAGCATAKSLAERGLSVTLIEQHPELASEGSGNPQGILYPKLSNRSSPLARFGLASLLYAGRYHREHLNQTGLLVLPESESDIALFSEISQLYPDDLVQLIPSDQLTQTAGVTLVSACGLFFPSLGWINPPQVCQALVEHNNIQIVRAEIDQLSQNSQQQWLAEELSGAIVAAADIAIIACGNSSARFGQTSHLPLKPIRGQISSLPETAASGSLKTVICGQGYLAPAANGHHTLGASYNIGEKSTLLTEADHLANLRHLEETDSALPKLFGDPDTASMAGRAAFRCTTPDYLPIAGPAPKLDHYLEDYQLLRKNARAHIPVAGKYWQGLYLNCGHGSRGMSYAPLCAELIASHACHEAPPLELDLRQAIHPGRFIIRNLKRNKV